MEFCSYAQPLALVLCTPLVEVVITLKFLISFKRLPGDARNGTAGNTFCENCFMMHDAPAKKGL